MAAYFCPPIPSGISTATVSTRASKTSDLMWHRESVLAKRMTSVIPAMLASLVLKG